APLQAVASLNDHDDFRAALDLPFPAENRDHFGYDINANGKSRFHQPFGGDLRLDKRRIGRIDENRLVHRSSPVTSRPTPTHATTRSPSSRARMTKPRPHAANWSRVTATRGSKTPT